MNFVLIDVRDILKSSGLSKTIELEFTAAECGIPEPGDGSCFSQPFHLKAELSNIKGIIRVKGGVKTMYDAYCARCLKPLRVTLEEDFDDGYVQYGTLGPVSAEDAEVFVYSDKEIDVGCSVREAALLGVPIRHLCGENCLSLCQICGKDLNEGDCGCERAAGDARFAALGALLGNGENDV